MWASNVLNSAGPHALVVHGAVAGTSRVPLLAVRARGLWAGWFRLVGSGPRVGQDPW